MCITKTAGDGYYEILWGYLFIIDVYVFHGRLMKVIIILILLIAEMGMEWKSLGSLYWDTLSLLCDVGRYVSIALTPPLFKLASPWNPNLCTCDLSRMV